MPLLAAVKTALAAATVDGHTVTFTDPLVKLVWVGMKKALETAGGVYVQRHSAFRFPEPAGPLIERMLATGEVVADRHSEGYVPTPDELADRVAREFALVGSLPPGAVVLEPSAGDGRLVGAILAVNPDVRVCALEPDPVRFLRLQTATEGMPVDLYQMTFEEFLGAHPAAAFDAVVMNPPFNITGQRDIWIQHVIIAFRLLRAGGHLAAIVPHSFQIRTAQSRAFDAIRALVKRFGGYTALDVADFRDAGIQTGVLWMDQVNGPGGVQQRYLPTRAVFDLDPIRVAAVNTSAGAPPVQLCYDGWRSSDRVARNVGLCVTCAGPVWGFDDGENDPRGALGTASCCWSLHAEDYDLAGPTLLMCVTCADNAERRKRGRNIAMGYWTQPDPDDNLYPGITYVISCGREKLGHAAPAGRLYTGRGFRHALRNVTARAAADEADGTPARILILSAKYGLVTQDQVLEPYDQRMDQPGSIPAAEVAEQARVLGIGYTSRIYAFMSKAYMERLCDALRPLDANALDGFEACGSIFDQRRVLSNVGKPAITGQDLPEDGLTVWIGADTSGFAWATPILVSYGRLRRVTSVLPVATAPWVCDSRAFLELAEHGTWTISPEQYAADLTRYQQEIGRLHWAAPQDWPCGPDALAATGLGEAEHQRRTIASTQRLRELAPTVPILYVVTGETPAGYLRHLEMYRQAGVDLAAETLPVGVGALVGRPPAEVADIIRMLYAAGLRNLHGFGVKGPVLEDIGALLTSIDSSAWARETRWENNVPCPHGIVKLEVNCPEAAKTWAAEQRARAARAEVNDVTDDMALCALGRQVSGEDHGACAGQVQLVEFEPAWTRPESPRPEPTQVYLCEAHRPADGEPAQLGEYHPVVLWDLLAETARYDTCGAPDLRGMRMAAARRIAHELPQSAADIEVCVAAGLDGAAHYRWSLPYLRAYTALLIPALVHDEYDQLVARFRPGLDEAAETLALASGPYPVGHQGMTCAVGGELLPPGTGWWLAIAPGRGWRANRGRVCGTHALQPGEMPEPELSDDEALAVFTQLQLFG